MTATGPRRRRPTFPCPGDGRPCATGRRASPACEGASPANPSGPAGTAIPAATRGQEDCLQLQRGNGGRHQPRATLTRPSHRRTTGSPWRPSGQPRRTQRRSNDRFDPGVGAPWHAQRYAGTPAWAGAPRAALRAAAARRCAMIRTGSASSYRLQKPRPSSDRVPSHCLCSELKLRTSPWRPLIPACPACSLGSREARWSDRSGIESASRTGPRTPSGARASRSWSAAVGSSQSRRSAGSRSCPPRLRAHARRDGSASTRPD